MSDKFETFDEGDFWGIRLNGEDININECAEYVESLQARIKELESIPTGKAPCIKFCEATAFKYKIAALERDKEKLNEDVAKAGLRAREEMQPRWISVEDGLPKPGESVVSFRPQVIQEDYTDKPLRMQMFNGKHFIGGCHKPSQWLRIPLPFDWSPDHEKRQDK